jgi:hypothetical protein
MVIQNARHRAKLKKGKEMEQQAEISTMQNGFEGSGPSHMIDPAQGIDLKALLDKRDKMLQGLNSLKADCEAMKKQVEDQEYSIKRTEGALIMLTNLITEINPSVLQSQQGR